MSGALQPLSQAIPEDYTEATELEEQTNELAEDDSSIIGVSIGRAQTRLLSSSARKDANNFAYASTPEPADIASTYPQPVCQQRLQRHAPSSINVKSTSNSETSALPSPWHSRIKTGWIFGNASNDPQYDLDRTKRSNTGLESTLPVNNGLRRLVGSLSSLPKFVTAPRQLGNNAFVRSNDADDSQNQHQRPAQGPLGLIAEPGEAQYSRSQSSTDVTLSPHDDIDTTHPPQPERPPMLRRPTSDGTLDLHRTLSKASSLGDDARWTSVHKQVNSRMKAIQDSWQDSSFKLPKLPELPNLPRLPELGSLSLNSSLLDFPSPRKRANTLPNLDSQSKVNQKRQSASNSAQQSQPVSSAVTHPYFTKALENLTGDVVILGGYRGSVLRSAEPPHRQYWVPIKVGLNLRKVNLEVGLRAEDEETMEQTIIASGMLRNIGPVEISKRLFKRLRTCPNAVNGTLRVWDFGYDWRLSPHLLSRKLQNFLQKLPCNAMDTPVHARGATIIAHSLGGLITRHVINKQPELCRGIVYAGTPQTCVNILGPLRNGDNVFLSSRVLTAQVNFTIRTSFALLPLDGKCFFNRDTGEEFRVDFFDPKTWEAHCLSPCVAKPLVPALASKEPPAEQTSMLANVRGSIASVLSNVSSLSPVRRNSLPRSGSSHLSVAGQQEVERPKTLTGKATHETQEAQSATLQPRMDTTQENNMNPSTNVTIPKAEAYDYLTRTLSEIKTFKEELAPIPKLKEERRYPPASVMYGKSVPTVCGAHVTSPNQIKYTSAYDDLAFASGDGVVLAKAAMLPEGYEVARGGVISSERGHITLLSDLEAVGQALCAVIAERRRRRRETTEM